MRDSTLFFNFHFSNSIPSFLHTALLTLVAYETPCSVRKDVRTIRDSNCSSQNDRDRDRNSSSGSEDDRYNVYDNENDSNLKSYGGVV